MAKILNSKTEPVPNRPQAANETFSLISDEKLLAIYTAMVKCRMLEQRATMLFQQGKLGSDLHGSAGREASAAAVCIDLQPEDTLSIAPHDWLPAFLKGMSLEGVFRALDHAESQRDSRDTGELMQKNLVIPANHTPPLEMIRERAADAQTQSKGAIVLVFIPAEPNSLRPWQKTMAQAGAKKLPIVFMHYVNHSLSTQTKTRSGNPAAMLHGVPAIAVDAGDPVAVYRVAFEAIIRARQARGATLIECTTSPTLPSASGMNNGVQRGDETASADPLAAMEAHLKRTGIEPGPHNRLIVENFTCDLDLATRFLDR